MKKPIIGIDFDGTLAKHEYPRIGEEVPAAFYYCLKFQELGGRLILHTMRSLDSFLPEALDWCNQRKLKFWGINNNPEQASWTSSPKTYCNCYIDDANANCPLIYPTIGRPWVDWFEVGPWVLNKFWEEHAGNISRPER